MTEYDVYLLMLRVAASDPKNPYQWMAKRNLETLSYVTGPLTWLMLYWIIRQERKEWLHRGDNAQLQRQGRN